MAATESIQNRNGDATGEASAGEFLAVVAVFVLLFILTRLLDLGRQSPWNDEVANWLWARGLPEIATPPHPLTYWVQRFFLNIHDSVFMLRLPGALAMLLAGLLPLCVLRSAGVAAMTLYTILFTLSPMAIFFSQDANHYGYVALLGTFCAVVAAKWWRSGRPPLLWLASAAVVSPVLFQAHLVTAFPIAAMVAAILIDVVIRPQRFARGRIQPRQLRMGAIFLIAAAAAIGIHFAVRTIESTASDPVPGAVYFSLSPAFIARLCANFFGAYLHHSALDYLLGLAGLVASVSGWFWHGRRNRSATGALVFLATCAAGIAAVFGVFQFRHAFHVKLLIFFLPMLLAGIALLVAEASAAYLAAREQRTTALLVAALLLFGAMALRSVVWMGSYYGGEFQPALPALRYAEERLPAGAIVGTRSKFLAKSLSFLHSRYFPQSTLRYIWLGESFPSSACSVQLALKLEHENPGRMYLLDMAAIDEAINVHYHLFANESAEEIARFGSSMPADFYGFDRSLVLRKVLPIEGTGALPLGGMQACAVWPVDGVAYFPAANPQHLALGPGSGAAWWLREPVADDLIVTVRWRNESKSPLWLFADRADGVDMDSGRVVAWQLPAGQGSAALRWPREAVSGATTLRIALANAPQLPPSIMLEVARIEAAGSHVDEQLIQPTSLRFAPDVENEVAAITDAATASGPVVSTVLAPPAKTGVAVLFSLHPQGLASHGLVARVAWRDSSQRERRLNVMQGRETGYFVQPGLVAAIVPAGLATSGVLATVEVGRRVMHTPHGGGAKVTRPLIALVGEDSAAD